MVAIAKFNLESSRNVAEARSLIVQVLGRKGQHNGRLLTPGVADPLEQVTVGMV